MVCEDHIHVLCCSAAPRDTAHCTSLRSTVLSKAVLCGALHYTALVLDHTAHTAHTALVLEHTLHTPHTPH